MLAEFCGHFSSTSNSGLGQKDHEFFSTKAEGKISGTYSVFYPLGKFTQYRVAETMTVGIVNLFEVIKVKHQAGQVCVIACATLKFMGQDRIKMSVIIKSGQVISDGELFKDIFLLNQLILCIFFGHNNLSVFVLSRPWSIV